MQVKFDKRKDFVYETTYNIPVSLADDLPKENWIADKAAYGQIDFSLRHRAHAPYASTAVQDLMNYFHSDVFKQAIIDQLYSERDFPGYWGISPERMFRATTAFGTLTLDKPGFVSGMHLDNRALVASGMCYLIEGDDPQQSTTFYANSQKEAPLRISTGWGKGWIAANMHDSWHDGHNASSKDRYTVLLGLVIRL